MTDNNGTTDEVDQLLEQIPENAEIPEDADAADEQTVEGFASALYNEFTDMGVPPEKARQSVLRKLDTSGELDEKQDADIDDLSTGGRIVSIEGTVETLLDADSPKIKQMGIIGDDTGTTLFKDFGGGDTDLQEGQTYALNGVKVDEYQGRYSVVIQDESTIEDIEKDFDVPEEDGDFDRGETEEFTAPIVDMTDSTGLIKRDSETNTVKPVSADGENLEMDMRAIAQVDNGQTVRRVIIRRENLQDMMEEATGEAFELDTAIQMAHDNLGDGDPVARKIRDALVGRWYVMKAYDAGDDSGGLYVMEEYQPVAGEADVQAQAEQTLAAISGGEQ